MPNWKTHESAVRLLAAVLAAHPELKLNYQEISHFYGQDCTKYALEHYMRGPKKNAKMMRDGTFSGGDDAGTALGPTPVKRARVNKSVKKDESEDDVFETPNTKRAKTAAKNGRSGNKKAPASTSKARAASVEDLDEEEEINDAPLKIEGLTRSNGHSNGHGSGHITNDYEHSYMDDGNNYGNGYEMGEEDIYSDARQGNGHGGHYLDEDEA